MSGRVRIRGVIYRVVILFAAIFAIGTLYLILSPDPIKSGPLAMSYESGVASRLDCDNPSWGTHRVAVIVPYRDRFDELLEFAPYLHHFLCDKHLRHRILIINQADAFRFNRGALVNVGFLLGVNMSFDYIAVHDVDLLPANQNLSYGYPEDGPFHVSPPDLHPKYHYEKFLGGILLMTNEHFWQVRGFSNKFWGWGREDDEFYRRIQDAGLEIHRPTGITTGNRTFRHLHDSMRRPRDGYRYGDQKAYLRRDRQTGVDNVVYHVLSKRFLRIDNSVEVTVFSVHLNCQLEVTPWCLTPRQLATALRTERERLSPAEFAQLEETLQRHGMFIELPKVSPV